MDTGLPEEDELDANDDELDMLWENVREQLTDQQPTGDKFAHSVTNP